MRDLRIGRRTRLLLGLAAVAVVALLTALLAQIWYRTVREGETQADRRGMEQVAALLLRRIDRQGTDDVDAIIADFDVAVRAHVVVVAPDGTVVVSPGTPPAARSTIGAVEETVELQVRRRAIEVDDVRYDVYGGRAPGGARAYVIARAVAPERASSLRPTLLAGWVATVVVAALASFGIGRWRAARIRRAGERERSLTSAIAHELRTPLSSVVTAGGLLAAQVEGLPASARRPVQVLLAELDRLRVLVEDLLEMARLEAGDHATHLEVVALADVVGDVLEARSWEEEVDLDLDLQAAAAVDRLSISRVVLNLVDNALRHGGGRVCVRVAPVDRDVLLQVSDGGHGVAAEDLERLLAGDASSGAGRRGSLGLRIAQQNAALHGARITVEVDATDGTTFSLRLPAVAPIDRGQPERW